jgi:hypothetical protein
LARKLLYLQYNNASIHHWRNDMGYAAETIDDTTLETGYFMRELEFPDSPESWDLDDFAELLPSNDSL